MTKIRLSSRLLAIANLVPSVGSVADIGTDHGYIPVWLSQSDHTGKLYATDINREPLEHAMHTADEYGLTRKIDFFLCDGLASLNGIALDTVVIAGMGGETIAEILSAAPWIKELHPLMILQPMSKSSFLRLWLFDNGYRVLSEQLVKDGMVYEILTACIGEDAPYSPAELLVGHNQLIISDPLFSVRLNYLTEKLNRVKSGLIASSKPEDASRLDRINDICASLAELKLRKFKN